MDPAIKLLKESLATAEEQIKRLDGLLEAEAKNIDALTASYKDMVRQREKAVHEAEAFGRTLGALESIAWERGRRGW